ncbi:phage/plasmid replication domain-containing protein [Candidatus Galacturonibacter soehngenii]|uniref:Uncharacterized protein n=1 Tax=Candidatus Galacturonatibacter soehngenii TaxID=2307010 RepID=A0A7V7QJN2_9FIRM|nr:phage/plasmid replication protein [Candidatus Galacturonibacter soehngenii]KAB1437887.1 hypothetical protein F7O84_09885 [Candidatus Galacturonibacter soehngenii]
MHTFALSMLLSSKSSEYNTIRRSLPFSTVKLNDYATMHICKTSKMNISEEEKKTIPVIKLYKFEELKTTMDGEKKPTGKITYFLELVVNYMALLGGTGFYSIPASSINDMASSALINHFMDILPQLNYSWYMENEFIKKVQSYNRQILKGDDSLSIWEILTLIAISNDETANRFIEEHNLNRSVLLNLTSKGQQESYLKQLYYPPFKLRRIDYSCDIHTDFKDILLSLMIKGFDPKQLKLEEKIYYQEKEEEYQVVSDYHKSKSVRLNIYDKIEELKKHNQPLSLEDQKRADSILRFEVQVFKNKLNDLIQRKSDELGYEDMSRDLYTFAQADIEKYVLSYYLKKIVGTGHYFTLNIAKSIVDSSHYTNSKKEKLKKVLHYVAINHGIPKFLEKIQEKKILDLPITTATTKIYFKELESIGINPVCISQNMQQQMKQRVINYPLPDINGYQYGRDFLYNLSVYLEMDYQISSRYEETI